MVSFIPFLELILKKRIAGSQDICGFNFRKYCQTVFGVVVQFRLAKAL